MRPERPIARALSGLSMGGIQTLNIGLHNLGTFRYLAVHELGLDERAGSRALLQDRGGQNAEIQLRIEALLVGLGRDGHRTGERTAVIEKFKSQGVRIETRETPGGHTWDNWRLYLSEVAPKLFR